MKGNDDLFPGRLIPPFLMAAPLGDPMKPVLPEDPADLFRLETGELGHYPPTFTSTIFSLGLSGKGVGSR